MTRKQTNFSLSLAALAALTTSTLMISTSATAFEGDDITTSGSVTLLTDYRFRGISLSDKKAALQGSLEVSKSGFYVGSWASSLTEKSGANLELDYYGGYRGTLKDLDYDVGLTVYTYPGLASSAYVEAYGYLSGTVAKTGITTGVAYVWGQDNLGGQKNGYIILDSGTELTKSGISLNTHIGYEDGAFADKKWDWSAGLSLPVDTFTLSVDYIDTNQSFREGGAGVIASLSASF